MFDIYCADQGKLNNPHTPRVFGQVIIYVRADCLRGLVAGMEWCLGVPFQRTTGYPATDTVHSMPSLVLNLVK